MPAVTPPAAPGAALLASADEVLAQARTENFPVASRLLPAAARGHLMALYGYARLVDDLGDEAPGDRGALLDAVEAELDTLFAGGEPTHALLRRLAVTVRARDIPRRPLDRLVAANRQDQEVTRYADFAALLAYCDLSATPVGELVLYAFGVATPERIALSDRICAALQVIEHLQDVSEDLAAGRVYLPQADMQACGCTEDDLHATTATASFRAVMAMEAGRARALLAVGLPLVRTLPLRPAFAVASFVAGGRAALDALERAGWDVLGAAPRPTKGMVAASLARTLVEARR